MVGRIGEHNPWAAIWHQDLAPSSEQSKVTDINTGVLIWYQPTFPRCRGSRIPFRSRRVNDDLRYARILPICTLVQYLVCGLLRCEGGSAGVGPTEQPALDQVPAEISTRIGRR